MERTIVDLNKARRRRIAVWTPWGVVPIDKARKTGGRHLDRGKHETRDGGKQTPERKLAS